MVIRRATVLEASSILAASTKFENAKGPASAGPFRALRSSFAKQLLSFDTPLPDRLSTDHRTLLSRHRPLGAERYLVVVRQDEPELPSWVVDAAESAFLSEACPCAL